jgi:type VI secretion system protein
MLDRSLFERLERSEDGRLQAPGPLDRSALLESVIANVRAVLNARQGCCETRPDYGMVDLNDAAGARVDFIAGVVRAVQEQIEAFEPRLSEVRVRHAPEEAAPPLMAFHVSAALKLGDGKEPVRFETLLGDDRRLRVRG